MCKELKDNFAKLTELRLDYAWKYFESAAKQRMLFLNYFLIAVGILASAYGFALKEKLYPIAIFICFFGLIVSIGFIFFDIRMLAFVERALRALETLEREELFKDGYLHAKPSQVKGQQLGLARIEPDHRTSGRIDLNTGHMLTKTKFWLRFIEGAAAVGFIAGTVFATSLWVNPNTHSEKMNNISSSQKNVQTNSKLDFQVHEKSQETPTYLRNSLTSRKILTFGCQWNMFSLRPMT